jgi:hypothetical protein
MTTRCSIDPDPASELCPNVAIRATDLASIQADGSEDGRWPSDGSDDDGQAPSSRRHRAQSFAELSVSTISDGERVARSGFYFYIESTYSVLAVILGEAAHELELTQNFAPLAAGESRAAFAKRMVGSAAAVYAHNRMGARGRWTLTVRRRCSRRASRYRGTPGSRLGHAHRLRDGPGPARPERCLVWSHLLRIDRITYPGRRGEKVH